MERGFDAAADVHGALVDLAHKGGFFLFQTAFQALKLAAAGFFFGGKLVGSEVGFLDGGGEVLFCACGFLLDARARRALEDRLALGFDFLQDFLERRDVDVLAFRRRRDEGGVRYAEVLRCVALDLRLGCGKLLRCDLVRFREDEADGHFVQLQLLQEAHDAVGDQRLGGFEGDDVGMALRQVVVDGAVVHLDAGVEARHVDDLDGGDVPERVAREDQLDAVQALAAIFFGSEGFERDFFLRAVFSMEDDALFAAVADFRRHGGLGRDLRVQVVFAEAALAEKSVEQGAFARAEFADDGRPDIELVERGSGAAQVVICDAVFLFECEDGFQIKAAVFIDRRMLHAGIVSFCRLVALDDFKKTLNICVF